LSREDDHLRKKTAKRFELVENYLLKICDRGHHTYFNVELRELSLDEITELCEGRVPNIKQMVNSGYADIRQESEWDKYLEGKGRSNTTDLIQRDVKLYWAIENIRKQEKVSKARAIEIVSENWPSGLGAYLGEHAIDEIYRNYAPVFRLVKKTYKIFEKVNSNWLEKTVVLEEDPTLNFPLRDGAAYALREMKVITGRYPIDRPTGIFEDIHRIFELPFEEDIEREIEIYQRIRKRAFGVTYNHPLGLKLLSMGSFRDRLEDTSNRLGNTIKQVSRVYEYDFNKLITLYRHYRLIEAEDNAQDRLKVYEQLESDLAKTELF